MTVTSNSTDIRILYRYTCAKFESANCIISKVISINVKNKYGYQTHNTRDPDRFVCVLMVHRHLCVQYLKSVQQNLRPVRT